MSKQVKTGIKVGRLGGSYTEQPRSIDEAMWLRTGRANSFKPTTDYVEGYAGTFELPIAKLKPKTLRGRFVAWLARILRAS